MPPGSPFPPFRRQFRRENAFTTVARPCSATPMTIALLSPVADFLPLPTVEPELPS